MSNTNTPNTLLSLLENYRVEIPRLQRDYVQGQDHNEQVKTVRATLLKDIKDATNSNPLDLNFVYGKAVETKDGKRFLPVDGQQRLTTLFLLHLYAFSDDDSKTSLFNKFSYEARTTTRDFFLALNKYRKEIFSAAEKSEAENPSIFITDASWFVDSWKYDPSVKSSLTMLDDIVDQGYDKAELRSKFENSDEPAIFFHFVELTDLGREDDLYIKINVRGRPLTPFENFKSQFVTQCQKVCDNLYNEIESALDIKWADYIWSKGHEENYDKYYLRFFQYVLLNHKLLLESKESEESKKNQDPDDFNWIYSFDYSTIEPHIFKIIRNTLNYISFKTSSDASDTSSDVNIIPDASDITVDLLKINRIEYSKRVLFHAVCKYLETEDVPEKVDSDEFSAWLRVIRNLVNNSTIDKLALCTNAIDSINKLVLYKKDNISIYEYLAKPDMSENLPGFNSKQVEEERQKAKIIISGSAQKQAILDAEKELEYFGGQIISAIFFSGLKGLEDDISNFDISKFNNYVKKIKFFFGPSAPVDGDLLRRALCTFSDYRLSVGSYKTLCVDSPNDDSTPSLKDLFSEHGDTVKKLLDSVDVNKPLKDELEKIIANATIPQSDWRYCIVNYPELLEKHYMYDSRYEYNYQMKLYRMSDVAYWDMHRNHIIIDTLMIPKSAANGYCASIFLYTLKIALDKKGKRLYYDCGKGSLADRYLHLDLYLDHDKKEIIRVTYVDGKYTVKHDSTNGTVNWESSRQDQIDETVEYISRII